MFDTKHYVPVLRWKAAEKEALEKLSNDQKNIITPVIELIMPQPVRLRKDGTTKTTEELLAESIQILKQKFPKIPEEILKYWGKSPIFIDLNLIDFSLRADGLTQILSVGNTLGLHIIPIVTLNSPLDIQNSYVSSVRANAKGIALRLFRSNLNSSTIVAEIENIRNTYKIEPYHTDLIVDLQITDGQCLKLAEIIEKVPNIQSWRTFTVISGAFPKDLTNFLPDLHKIDRYDWNSWLNQINLKDLKRSPSFGDYTIQHPIYGEPTPGMNPSASIRYTLNDKYMIMRGQGLRSEKSTGFAQYPANAQLLSQQQELFGESFSFGDKYIFDKGKDVNTKETGTPRTWLRAGINHHLACVVFQIANLP